MEAFAVWLLLALNGLVGVQTIPTDLQRDWSIHQTWKYDGYGYVLEASSTLPATLCSRAPQGDIQFPRVIHSAVEITVSGTTIFRDGDFNFNRASPFYHQPVVPCSFFPKGSETVWKVSTYSPYFARLSDVPKLSAGASFREMLNVEANIVTAGVLIVLSLLSVFLFRGKIPSKLLLTIIFGNLTVAGYFLNVANSKIELPLTMLQSHRTADLCLWNGALLLFYAFYQERVMTRFSIVCLSSSVAVGSLLILFGQTGSQIQIGTMVPMLFFVLASLDVMRICLKSMMSNMTDHHHTIRFFSVASFFIAGNCDVATIFGLQDINMMLPFGAIAGFFGLSVAVNQDIDRTYQERDSLLQNLEKKVQEKTAHLSETLTTLKSTQAELVQSAKLASLGTLSAGVAHEINNSINYVSGALKPLERKLSQLLPPNDQTQIMKLLEAIKEGTSLTVGIVNSLRVYTGLNQSQFKEFNLHDVVQSTLTILKSKSRGIEITVQMEAVTMMHGSIVGLSQVVMNLIANALDALPKESGRIWITAESNDVELTLRIKDNGSGIPQAIQERIFEPFFTTKDVGKGTGLGLHIVRQEIERHHGAITLKSEPGSGTEFVMVFPAKIEALAEAA